MAPHGNNSNIMNAFAAMEEEERRQKQQQQQQASSVFTGNSTHSNNAVIANNVNVNTETNRASVIKSDVSPLHAFLRRQRVGQQVQRQDQRQIFVGGTGEDENDFIMNRVWNPFHDMVDGRDNLNEDDEEYCPLPIDSDQTDVDVNDVRDAVDIALAYIGGDCDDSLIDLNDVEEFFADVEEENEANDNANIGRGNDDTFVINDHHNQQARNKDYYNSSANHDSMTSFEFAPLAGSSSGTAAPAVVDRHQQYHPVSIEGMEVLVDGAGLPPNNNNMDYSSRNMGDSGSGSFASLGSLTANFSMLNQCMQQTSHTREMIQKLSSSNLHNDGFDISNHKSCSSMPNHSFHFLPSAGRSNHGRPTKSLTRLTKTDLLGRSSSLRSIGSTNSGGVRKTSTKSTLKSSSTSSLRSMGSSSTSSKRRSSSHLRGQRYTKKRFSSSNSLSTMKSDDNPLVTGIAPINWDGIKTYMNQQNVHILKT